jgi:hypothetical protein
VTTILKVKKAACVKIRPPKRSTCLAKTRTRDMRASGVKTERDRGGAAVLKPARLAENRSWIAELMPAGG